MLHSDLVAEYMKTHFFKTKKLFSRTWNDATVFLHLMPKISNLFPIFSIYLSFFFSNLFPSLWPLMIIMLEHFSFYIHLSVLFFCFWFVFKLRQYKRISLVIPLQPNTWYYKKLTLFFSNLGLFASWWWCDWSLGCMKQARRNARTICAWTKRSSLETSRA
jgi:hypothetical protein